jgi:hypothetical protein
MYGPPTQRSVTLSHIFYMLVFVAWGFPSVKANRVMSYQAPVSEFFHIRQSQWRFLAD